MLTGTSGFFRFFLCIFAVSGATIAADFTGHVLDPQQKPVANATVSLYSRDGSGVAVSTTDAAGQFAYHGLAEGDYLLRAETAGFANVIRDVVIPSAALDLTLQIASVRQQVVVTAAGTAQSPEEVSKPVTVIDRAEAETRDVVSLAGAVELAAGVRVQQSGGPGQLTAIRIRGMRAQDTSVLVDGLRVRDAGAPQGDASGMIQDLLLVDSSRVEVMNGAGSSLYGTGAIGGVVNLLSDEGGGRTHGNIGIEGGSLGAVRGRAQLSGAFLADRLQYSVGLAHVNVSSGVDGDDPFRDTSLQSRVGYRLTPKLRLGARLLAADSFAKQNTSPEQTGVLPASGIVSAMPFLTFTPGADDPDSKRAGRFLSGALMLSGQPTAKLNYSATFHTLESSRRYNDGPLGQGFQPFGNTRTAYDGRVQTVNGQVNYQLNHAHLLTAAYEFEDETFAYDYADSSDPGAASRVHAAQRSHAWFAQDQARFFDGRLQFSGGFRAQYFSLQRPEFGPAAGAPFTGIALHSPPAAYTGDGSAVYFLKRANTKLRAHAGRGYRAPSLYERFGAGFDSFYGYSTYGDPRLQPERSVSFDAGLEQTFARGRARASATYFYTSLDRVIGFGTFTGSDPFGRFFGYLNTNGGLSRGLELNAALTPLRWLSVTAAYTFIDATERTPVVGDNLRTFVIPRHQFSAAAVWRAGKRALVSFDTLQSGNYLAPIYAYPVTRVYQFDGLRRVNAQASYRLPLSEAKALRLFVRGENLAGQDYFENGFRTPGRTATGGARFEF